MIRILTTVLLILCLTASGALSLSKDHLVGTYGLYNKFTDTAFTKELAEVTIVMECQQINDADPTHYKYESSLIGKDKVFNRKDGQWREWGTAGDRSLIAERTHTSVADQDWSGSNLNKGDEYQNHQKWVYDFVLFKYMSTWYMTHMDGSPLVPGRKTHDGANPRIDERLCKRPDESWQDRESR
jgi:hypothetical protein